jgi:hypothetical protein
MADDRNHSPAAAAANPLPKCICGWKNCRVYQKAFRECNHEFYDGVFKIKFVKGETESMALKQAIDRILKVAFEKRGEWKQVKGQDMARYTIARHHFTELHVRKCLGEPKFSFLKPFSIHGAKKYLYALDKRDTIANGKGDVFYLQVPNNPKEVVKTHFMNAKEALERKKNNAASQSRSDARNNQAPAKSGQMKSGSNHSYDDDDEDELSDDDVRTVATERSRPEFLLKQKEQENVKLKDQLESMQDQLSFLHDMVRKLQEEHMGGDNKSTRSGAVSTTRHQQQQQQRPAQRPSRRTLSGRSGRSGVPNEIELGDEVATEAGESQGWNDWSEHYDDDDDDNDEATVATFRSSYHNRGGGGDEQSVMSTRSRATSIVSASKSVKSLPREIELDEDEDDSESHESLEEEAFDNRSVASGWRGSQHSHSEEEERYEYEDDDDATGENAMGAGRASAGPNSKMPSRRTSISTASQQSTAGGRQKRRSSLASHLSKGSSGDNKSVSFDGKKGENSTDISSAAGGAGTYQVQALVVTDPYGEQGTYTGSISNSTNMPHGYGRLEYDRAGRWYEGTLESFGLNEIVPCALVRV